MLPTVKEVYPQENHEILVVFDNGERGILDMKPYLEFGVFKRLKNCESFKQIRVAFDTVEWSSGVDLDPEFIYNKCKREKKDEKMDRGSF